MRKTSTTRELVERAHEAGKNICEIARELGISRQCVSQHIHRSEKIVGTLAARKFIDRANKARRDYEARRRSMST